MVRVVGWNNWNTMFWITQAEVQGMHFVEREKRRPRITAAAKI
jgi:hypothetical protein